MADCIDLCTPEGSPARDSDALADGPWHPPSPSPPTAEAGHATAACDAAEGCAHDARSPRHSPLPEAEDGWEPPHWAGGSPLPSPLPVEDAQRMEVDDGGGWTPEHSPSPSPLPRGATPRRPAAEAHRARPEEEEARHARPEEKEAPQERPAEEEDVWTPLSSPPARAAALPAATAERGCAAAVELGAAAAAPDEPPRPSPRSSRPPSALVSPSPPPRAQRVPPPQQPAAHRVPTPPCASPARPPDDDLIIIGSPSPQPSPQLLPARSAGARPGARGGGSCAGSSPRVEARRDGASGSTAARTRLSPAAGGHGEGSALASRPRAGSRASSSTSSASSSASASSGLESDGEGPAGALRRACKRARAAAADGGGGSREAPCQAGARGAGAAGKRAAASPPPGRPAAKRAGARAGQQAAPRPPSKAALKAAAKAAQEEAARAEAERLAALSPEEMAAHIAAQAAAAEARAEARRREKASEREAEARRQAQPACELAQPSAVALQFRLDAAPDGADAAGEGVAELALGRQLRQVLGAGAVGIAAEPCRLSARSLCASETGRRLLLPLVLLEWFVRSSSESAEGGGARWLPAERALLAFDARIGTVGAAPSGAWQAALLACVRQALRAHADCRLTVALVGTLREPLQPLLVALEALSEARVRCRIVTPCRGPAAGASAGAAAGGGGAQSIAPAAAQLAWQMSLALHAGLLRELHPPAAPSFLEGRAKADLLTTAAKPRTQAEGWVGMLRCLVPESSADAIARAYPTFAALDAAWRQAGEARAPRLLAPLRRETATGVALGPLDSERVHRFFNAEHALDSLWD